MILAADCLNNYPDHDYPFIIATDASDLQMGAVIMQIIDGKIRPIAYFSRKFDAAQINYSTCEKEMLSVVMCLKEYRKMLYGAEITVYTDHKNLMFRMLSVQRVLRWWSFIDEYDVTMEYIKGKDNVIVDCFSHLPQMDQPAAVGDEQSNKYGNPKGTLIDFKII